MINRLQERVYMNMGSIRKMDYHLHSTHSIDGRQTLDEICRQAVELDLAEICITDHIEPHHPDPGVDKPPVFSDWLTELAAVRERYPALTIRQGIEIGDNAPYRDEIAATLDALPLDFRLLSLHLVDNVDPYHPEYFEGKTQMQAYRRYVQQRVESILNFPDYDAIAHLGYVGKFAPYPPDIRPLRYHHAPDELDMLLKHLKENGKALEINASGLRGTDSPIPGADIIRRFIELGGEFFTFGSDAHTREHIYLHVERAKEIARSCGARWQLSFERRKGRSYTI